MLTAWKDTNKILHFSHGNIRDQNMSREEILGIKSLKERIKQDEIRVAPTDKSGKLAVNTKKNYLDISVVKCHIWKLQRFRALVKLSIWNQAAYLSE